MLTLKKHKYLFLNLLILCILSLLVVKYCEEIHILKEDAVMSVQQLLLRTKSDVSETAPTEETDYVAAKTTEPPVEVHPVKANADAWFADSPLIYHAGGGIQGSRYTNSLEAIQQTLAKEQYFIEIDLAYTSDGHLVCAHTWSDVFLEDQQPTLEEFLQTKIQGKFTPLTAEDLLHIMAEHPRMHLVVDTKEPDSIARVIADLAALAGSDPAILDRFIIQLYTGEEKASILEIYPFADEQFLLTLYVIGYWNMELAALCNAQNISVITIPHSMMPQEDVALLRELGFTLYEHTVNRADSARVSLEKGISSFYTDYLSPDDLWD